MLAFYIYSVIIYNPSSNKFVFLFFFCLMLSFSFIVFYFGFVFCIYIMFSLFQFFVLFAHFLCLLWSKNFLCLIRWRSICAGFSLFYRVSVFYFCFVGGTYPGKIQHQYFGYAVWVDFISAEYFHPSYFLYIITLFDLFSLLTLSLGSIFLKIQSGLIVSSPLGIISRIFACFLVIRCF